MSDLDRPQLETDVPQADYGAWRERLRSKSQRNRTMFTPPAPDAPKGPSPYWDPETLFAASASVEAAEDHSPLAVLDLRESATAEEILVAYRNLAKLHHPDRWIDADDGTRQHHDDCMKAVNDAYTALRASNRV
jgi:DnaJ-domain-containing protein 1